MKTGYQLLIVSIAMAFTSACSDVSFSSNSDESQPLPSVETDIETTTDRPERDNEPTEFCTTDTFIQAGAPISEKLDLLFITDTSGSLDQERNQVAEGIDGFLAALPQSIDVNIGVLLAHGSTSSYAGKLYQSLFGEASVLKSSELDLSSIRQDLKRKLTSVPSDQGSDGGESGLYSLDRALSQTNLFKSQGMFRDDAALAIVFITDENDICADYPAGVTPVLDNDGIESISKARDCGSVSSLSVFVKLKLLKEGLPLVTTGVVYTGDSPVPFGGENEIGYGILDIIQLSGDRVSAVDLGGDSISQGLTKIGNHTAKKLSLLDSFFLVQSEINESTLQVTLDGDKITHDYNSLTQSIDISELGEPGSKIEASYCYKQ